jgi:SAM-dependent methyltransferase
VENLSRFSRFDVIDVSHPYFLHYRTLNKALSEASKYAVGRLLDIGCGNKPYEEYFELVTAYIGCDVVQSSLHRVDVISTATSLPFESESFDVAFSTQVIEHVAEYPTLLKEAFRLLKPQGHLIISGPMYWHLHEEPHDFYRFTKYGFRHILVIRLSNKVSAWLDDRKFNEMNTLNYVAVAVKH